MGGEEGQGSESSAMECVSSVARRKGSRGTEKEEVGKDMQRRRYTG